MLVALAVIILPDVLDGEKITRQQQFATMPLQPQLAERPFSSPEPAVRLKRSDESEPSVVEIAETAVIESSNEIANPTDQPLPQFKDSAWVLQLGVFRNAVNVNELISKIRKAGYPAFSKPKTPVQGQPTWVYVGPELDKEKLLTKITELKNLTGLNGTIYPYNPQSQ